jgi:hypothetical protein
MIVLFFLIGALALLVTVLLFGFVGCNWAFGLEETTAYQGDYPTVIKDTSGLIAYWRLGEPVSTPIPSSGGMAKSEVGGFHGDYFALNPVLTPDYTRHSPSTPGTITLGASGLLSLFPNNSSIYVDGGFVQVPFAPQLNPSPFSFEAWVSPAPLIDVNFYYCLVESTGPHGAQGLGKKKTGWGLYLGPSDPNNPTGSPLWQVWMGDGTQFKQVAIAKPDFPKDSQGQVISLFQLTYLVLTFDGSQKLQLFLYVPDNGQDLSFAQLQALTIPSSIAFQPNDNSTAGKGDFFIGAGSNLSFGGIPSQRLYPFKGNIQEAALYEIDLSAPDNAGIQSTLASHETSGGGM